MTDTSAITIIDRARDAIELIESGLADQEQVLLGIEFVKAVGELHRTLKSRFDTAAIAWIKQNGEIKNGARRVWVEPNKTIKCKDTKATYEAILAQTGGDLDEVFRCLASDPFKQGTTRKLLGPAADDLFETKVTSKIKHEDGTETAIEKLQDVDLDQIERYRK